MASSQTELASPPSRAASAERGSRMSQIALNPNCVWVRAAEHAPRDAFRVLERRHGLAEVVERGAVDFADDPRVITPHPEREII